MNNKEQFERINKIQRNIDSLREALERVQRRAEYPGISYSERVQTSHGNTSEGKMLTVTDTAIKLDNTIAEKEKQLQAILEAIDTIEDDLLQAIVRDRYANGYKISELADKYGYEEATIHNKLREGERAAKFK